MTATLITPALPARIHAMLRLSDAAWEEITGEAPKARPRRPARKPKAPKQLTHGILYRGPSLINGAPIVVVAVYRKGRGVNAKTGAMVQTYILPDSPDHIMDIMRDGRDVAVCGGCPHRYDYDAQGVAIPGTRTCYVNLGQGVRVVLEGVQLGRYATLSDDQIAEVGAERMVRLGTWGDPAAVPVAVWQRLLGKAQGHTGYTHQWRSERLAAPMRGLVMASCETDADVTKATAKGFTGTFRVLPVGQSVAPSAVCPASAEAGKVATCAECGRCDGNGGNVQIIAHGSMARKYLPTLS